MKSDKCGIYNIICKSTNKRYIGSSKSIYSRWGQHRYALNRGVSTCTILQKAWTKHGPDAFAFLIIEECDKSTLEEREQFYIDTLCPALNVVTSVERRDSPEIRAKIAAAVRARAALITHCPYGHAYDVENTYVGDGNKRICRTCNAARVAAIYAEETPKERAIRRKVVKEHYEKNREQLLAYQRDYMADVDNKEHKRDYDRLNRDVANERRRDARAVETPEQAKIRRAKKMVAHHKHLGRIDGKPPPREPISAEQRAKISATLLEYNAANPKPRNEPWIAEGISKTQWYRRLNRAAETPEETEARRAVRMVQYHANIESEREAMRLRYRKKTYADDLQNAIRNVIGA